MGCDLEVLLDRRKPKVDAAELIRRLRGTSYSRSSEFLNFPKWSIRSTEETECEIFATDGRCEIKVGPDVAHIYTDLGVLEFLSDRSDQGQIIEVVDVVAACLCSTLAVFLPDDIYPFQDMRESVQQGSMNVEGLASAVIQLGKQASTPSEMGEFNKPSGEYFECTKAFIKTYQSQ